MAIGGIVANNYLIEQVISAWRSTMNDNAIIHLFSVNIVSTPARVVGDFTESTFTGYVPVSLVGEMAPPIPIIPGEYEMAQPTVNFSCTGGTAENVWGYWIDDGGAGVYFCETFTAPINMLPGAVFGLQINLQEWALAIVG